MIRSVPRLPVFSIVLFLILTGCAAGPAATPTPAQPLLTHMLTLSASATASLTASPTQPSATPMQTVTLTLSVSATTSSTASPMATAIVSPTPQPTYAILRGEVIIDQAVCHYGPGAPYLYKYGVIRGSNLEIVRRVIGHNYIEVRAIGGDNPCWVRADYMQLKSGSLSDLEPVHVFDLKLPITPYYASPGVVSAVRADDQVTVSWPLLPLKAGDSSEQTPYIVEAWVCRAGQMVFDPVPAWQTSVTIADEAGCDQPSQASLIYAEKHGYTPRLAIPWPAPTP